MKSEKINLYFFLPLAERYKNSKPKFWGQRNREELPRSRIKLTQEQVDEIGQGRVWNGLSAKRIGLVDEIGGLEEAIVAAADIAELEDYKIEELPERKDPFEKILTQFATEARLKIVGSELGQAKKYYLNIKNALNRKGIYTRMPVDVMID